MMLDSDCQGTYRTSSLSGACTQMITNMMGYIKNRSVEVGGNDYEKKIGFNDNSNVIISGV